MVNDFNHLSYNKDELMQILKQNKFDFSKYKTEFLNGEDIINSVFDKVDRDSNIHSEGDETYKDGKLSGKEITAFIERLKDGWSNIFNVDKLVNIFSNEEQKETENEQFYEQFSNLSFTKSEFEKFNKLLQKYGLPSLGNSGRLFDTLQKKLNPKYSQDNDNTILSKQELANYLVHAKKKLPKEKYEKLLTVMQQMEAATSNAVTTENGEKILDFPAVDGNLSEAAKVMLQNLGIPVKQIENGKFDSVKIVTKMVDGEERKTAILTSSKHAYTFEIEFPHKSQKNKKNGAGSKIEYNFTGGMVLENVAIKKIDIGHEENRKNEHGIIFENSKLEDVTNSSGGPVLLYSKKTKGTGINENYINYNSTTNSDTYVVEYTESYHTKEIGKELPMLGKVVLCSCNGATGLGWTKKYVTLFPSREINKDRQAAVPLGPGCYAQHGNKDAGFIYANAAYRIPMKAYYTNDEGKRKELEISSNNKNDGYILSDNGISYDGKPLDDTYYEYSINTSTNSGKIQEAYVRGSSNFRTVFYDSQITVGSQIQADNTNISQYNQGLEHFSSGIKVGEIKSYDLSPKTERKGQASDGYDFLTKTCRLNKKQIKSFYQAGFTKLSVERIDENNSIITFINPQQGYSLSMSPESLTQYIEQMDIDVEKDKNGIKELNLDNIKGVLTINNPSLAPKIILGNTMLDINLPQETALSTLNIEVDRSKLYYLNVVNNSYGSGENGDGTQTTVGVRYINTPKNSAVLEDQTYSESFTISNADDKNKRFKPLEQ